MKSELASIRSMTDVEEKEENFHPVERSNNELHGMTVHRARAHSHPSIPFSLMKRKSQRKDKDVLLTNLGKCRDPVSKRERERKCAPVREVKEMRKEKEKGEKR